MKCELEVIDMGDLFFLLCELKRISTIELFGWGVIEVYGNTGRHLLHHEL